MKKIICILLVIQSSVALADNRPTASEKVFFDVTFWKKKLHITTEQLFKLQGINRDMYYAIGEANRGGGKSNLNSILESWKVSTIKVLSTRQRKKWEKLMEQYGAKGKV